MRGRISAAVLLAAFLACFSSPATGSGEGVAIGHITEPVIEPNPVAQASWASVSFEFGVINDDCRQAYVTESFPACAYVLQWHVTAGAPFHEGTGTILASGRLPYSPTLEQGGYSVVQVDETFQVELPPGTYEIHTEVDWLVGLPVSEIGGGGALEHAYSCGLAHQLPVAIDGVDCRRGDTGPIGQLTVT